MLNTSQFFNNLVSQYVGKYNSIAERFGGSRVPSTSIDSPSTNPANESFAQPKIDQPIQDSALLAQAPTLEAPTSDIERAKQDIYQSQNHDSLPSEVDDSDGSDFATSVSEPAESATYSNSFTNLRYKLKLEFNMQAIEQTVQQLSVRQDSESTTTDESFERLFSGGFNFSADLKISGTSVQASGTNISRTDNTTTSNGLAIGKYRHAEKIEHGRDLQRSAARTKRELPEDARGQYQVAVNRFSLRYKTDAQFSVNHFSRFQSQVERLAGENPESVGQYSDQAGLLAQSASGDVVGQFFDTVDSYMSNKEANLVENAERFFDLAAESLGLSPEAAQAAKTTVTGRIESFFDSVENNLDTLKAKFSGGGDSAVVDDNLTTLEQSPVSIDGSSLGQLAQTPTDNKNSMLSALLSAMQPEESDESDDHKPSTAAVNPLAPDLTVSVDEIEPFAIPQQLGF
ncbi:hypothetical protein JYU19_00535 [bacterium AH-315-J21]|nr:hypothetical protein [bacterium AH-315-J21]